MAEGGEGALVAQQKIATEIPYKNIEVAHQGIELAANAWQTANAIKLKKAELQDKMAALTMRNRQLEINDQIREKEMGLKVLGMEIGAGFKEQQLDLAKQRLYQSGENFQERFGLQQLVADQRHQKDMDRQESQQGLIQLESQLVEEGLEPGTREYANEYMKRSAGLNKGFSPSEFDAIHKSILDNLDAKSLQRTRLDEVNMRMFKEKVGAELFGNPGIQNLEPIINPQSLPDDWSKEHSWSHAKVTPGVKQIWYTDPTTGKSVKVNTAPVQKLIDLNKEYQELLDSQNRTARPRVDPNQVLPMPQNKADMKLNGKYNVPGAGIKKWDGNNLVPVQ